MSRITVTITNWEKFNPRKDYKRPTWFAMSNDIFDHPDFSDFSHSDFVALLYLFCQASKRNSPTFDIVFAHAKQRNISESLLSRVIEKLQSIQMITVIRTESVQNPSESARIRTLQTDKHTDKQTTGGSVDEFGPRELAEIWNARMGRMKSMAGKQMPLVDLTRLKTTQSRWKSAAARICEERNPEVWADAIDRMARSEFCRGKGARGDWVANFDFLVRPDVLTKILEGEYGCKPPPPPVMHLAAPVSDPPPDHVDDPSRLAEIRERVKQQWRSTP